MSEKRFVKATPFAVNDTWDNHRPMECASSLDADIVCHYLNEQQLVISKLDEHNTGYMVENLTLNKENNQLKEENKRLKKKLESLQKVLHLVECVSDE